MEMNALHVKYTLQMRRYDLRELYKYKTSIKIPTFFYVNRHKKPSAIDAEDVAAVDTRVTTDYNYTKTDLSHCDVYIFRT